MGCVVPPTKDSPLSAFGSLVFVGTAVWHGRCASGTGNADPVPDVKRVGSSVLGDLNEAAGAAADEHLDDP
jgi:hypothetical protein